MTAIAIRNLADEVHRALKARAAQHGRSTEAEIRHILEEAVQPRIGMGSALAAIGRRFGGVDLAIRRDPTSVVPAKFE